MPDFDHIFTEWPSAVSPHLDCLRDHVKARIHDLLSHASIFQGKELEHKRDELQAVDFGLFVAVWWPGANRDTLRSMSDFLLWLFIWDDEVDAADSRLGCDVDGVRSLVQTTLTYIEHTLLPATTDQDTITETDILITSFSHVASAIAPCDVAQRQRLCEEVTSWIKAVEIEHARRTGPELPRLGEYVDLRMKTSGMMVAWTLFEILTGLSCKVESAVPGMSRVICQDLYTLLRETNLLVSITNDVFSVRKELASGTPDNIMPIFWLQSRDLTTATNATEEMLRAARQRFDEAERHILACTEAPTDVRTQAIDLIEIFKTMCTGNITWSARSKRYGCTHKKVIHMHDVSLGQEEISRL